MNLNEIGRMAGVSRMTVSRYFNGGYISEDARLRIKKVVNETGFVPSAQARALKTKKTKTIGILISALESSLVVDIVNGIHKQLEEAGYQILIMRYLKSEELIITQINNLMGRGVDGLILSLVLFSKRIGEALIRSGIPCVTIGNESYENISGVIHNDKEGFHMIAQELSKKRYEKVGCFIPDSSSEMSKTRCNAVMDALNVNNLHIHHEWFFYNEDDQLDFYEKGQQLAIQLLKLDKADRPTVIIALSDQLAIGALSIFNRENVKIPEHLGITGYGNDKVSNYLLPSLTTVDLHILEIVNKSVVQLLEQINKNCILSKKSIINPLLILRESI